MIWQRMKSDKLGLLSLGFVLAVLAAGALAPLLAPHDPLEPDLVNKFAAMGLDYPLGTDHLGRCTFSRLLFGIRTTVLLSLATMAATLAVGTLLGVVGMLGPGLANVILASIVARWAWYTRMIRGAVVRQRSRNHILFARVAGCGSGHILLRHLLPDIAGEVSVLATLDTGWVILSISGLSFLCLGVQAPTPEWGMMLSEAKNIMTTHPSQMLAPGLAILAVVAAFNFLGDSIQAALNPRTDDIQARR
jgi:nickel transport system permease protein